MSLEHAILGFLNYEPMTGYDLKKMVDVSVSHFWPAVQSQIYRSLAQMEQSGWLEVETISQEPRPPRKVYHITDAGRNELSRWLETPQPAAESRLAWLIQVFFAGQMSDQKILVVLEYQLELKRKHLQGYTSIPEKTHVDMSEDDPRARFFWLLTVDYGVAQTVAQVRWLEDVIARIRRGDYTLTTL